MISCLKKSIFIFFLLVASNIYSQISGVFDPKIIPPSPTAYELGKYGQTDVGTFTGTPNISVPLYTYKTRNLSIPIALSYNSNGIKVDQMETNVGLGWNLNAGGIINRVVRGKPDEFRGIDPITEDDCSSSGFIAYMDSNQFLDTQPDLYSYNFNGHSGQFVFDKNNMAVLVPHNNLKIERLTINLKETFKITTDDGVEYHFFDNEYSTWENVDAPITVLTGWYLSRVIHPAGDIINFTYRDANYSFISNIGRSLPIKISVGTCPSSGNQSVNLSEEYSENTLSIMGKIIESISSTEAVFGNLTFQHIYNPNFVGSFLIKGYQVKDSKQNTLENTVLNYLFTTNNRIFLTECLFKDINKKYSFEYEDPHNLAQRLSNATDLWGFYNGKLGNYPDPDIHKDLYLSNALIMNAVRTKSNGDKRAYPQFASKGILTKIVYPTKGYNEFKYESNTVMGTVISDTQVKTENSWLYNNSYYPSEETKSFEFKNTIEHQTNIQAFVRYDGMDGDMSVGELFATVTIENLQSPHLNLTIVAYRHNINETRTYEFLANTDYKVTMVFSSEPKTSARINFTYTTGGGVPSVAPINVGGLRIQKITSFDYQLNKVDTKHYYYGKKETPNVSTGVEGVKMNLLNNTSVNSVCWDNSSATPFYTVVKASFLTVHPNSLYQLYNSNGNSSTSYENVTISYGGVNFENGGEELYYHASSDTRPSSCINNHLNSAPWTNTSWDNGLLVKKIIFNYRLITLNQSVYKYKLEDQYTKRVSGIAYDSKFNPVLFYTRPDIRNIEHLNINPYTTNSYWFYLESEENTQYDVKGLNAISSKTEFKYNNPQHLKLTSQITTNSVNEKLETKYFYPSDSEMSTEPFRNELIGKNMIGKVLDTQVLRQGVKLSEQKTIYDQSSSTSGFLFPKSIYDNKGQNSIDLNIDKKITFDQYDDKGNILQYTIENGSSVSIIWGYNKTQPIAKIENATYSQISSFVSNLQTLSDTGTEADLLLALSAFRNDPALANSMVTTYTHIPLVGVSTITDPKGDKTTYTYDNFGRLQFVKDKDGNILSENQYNYKQ